jgi:hypothetical protein
VMIRTTRLASWLASLAVACVPLVGSAQEAAPLRTTGDLLTLCDTSSGLNSDIRLAQCNGFIAGTGLLYVKLQRAGVLSQWACAPDRTGLNEARTSFVTWAKANPTYRDEDVTDGFWRAMATKWPCGQ